ncbi:multicopper oxidase domain-containing protein [bacterium]|nr:multicopper oxidase domain-containing protein [bacterium]
MRSFPWTLAAALAALASPPAPAPAAVIDVSLFLRPGELATVDARSLPALCFTAADTGAAVLPSPVLRVDAGDSLRVTLDNRDTAAHGFEIVGVGGAASSVPGGYVATFTFHLPDAGTFLYRDPVAYPVSQGCGLAGMLEVADPAATWDAENGWLLGDHSETWMTAADAGDPVNTAVYDPNYFTVNGLSGTDTMNDPRALVAGAVGDEILIRIANAGLRLHTIHFHGYHVEILRRNAVPLPAPILKDTVPIPVGETADLVLRPHQGGVFPIHDHVVLSVTANGVYPLGMIVFANITP